MKSKRILGLTIQAVAVFGLVSTSAFAQKTLERPAAEKGRIEELRRELKERGIEGERARELERQFTERHGNSAETSKAEVGAFLKEMNANGPRSGSNGPTRIESQMPGQYKAGSPAPMGIGGIGGLGLAAAKGGACEITSGGTTNASVVADIATARRIAGSTAEVVDQQQARLADMREFAKLDQTAFDALSTAERSALETRYEADLTVKKGEAFAAADAVVLAAKNAGLEFSTEGAQKTINSWGTDSAVLSGVKMIYARVVEYLKSQVGKGAVKLESVIADIRKFLVSTGRVSEKEANEFGANCAPSLLGLR
ncbi:MAG: hypothetical protein J0L93_07295 [Deltaproteobacteria bacterium]|nr:hypothetical protein [Deltaproteobacteria bacterium]